MEPIFLASFFGQFNPAVPLLAIIVVVLILGYRGAPLWAWTVAAALVLLGYEAAVWLWVVVGAVAVVLNVPQVRQQALSKPILNFMRSSGFMPTISKTERIALDAGTTWIESEFFSGKPDFKRIISEPYPELTQKEKEFIDGPVEELCRMTNDWQIYKEGDLPREIWDFLKAHRFFGMVIPEEYGGHGFTAYGMNAILAKIGSRSVPLCVDVMVPNSLGPAELLIHYGTPEQREHYLPRLARGEDIPCFALTEPTAGSDAAGISSRGEVFRGEDGELYLRLNWQKRYITLAAVSTVLGLAFQLYDPKNLLGKGKHPGITCGLIPTDTPGVKLGRRHDPLGVPFINSPTEGEDVVVSVNHIIGGPEQAGNGWRMLMETLAGGRGIFLPALNNGGCKAVARMGGAYAAVRQQFGMPIGKFEGIEELLARIGGLMYLQDGLNRFTCGALNEGKKPAVISAIAKYHATEMNRTAVNDAMDMVGGAGIILGPRNVLGHGYISIPIGITVEGSNIVTRTLIIFGQGVIRCHPYALKEMEAIQNNDLAAFDQAFWGHIGMTIRNKLRAGLLSLTRGHLVSAPVSGPTADYYKKLIWASATFSFMADLALVTLSGGLKFKEKLSGQFADVLSWLYLGSCALRKYEAEGRRKEDLPFVHWSLQYALYNIQQAFDQIFSNFPGTLPGAVFRSVVAAWSRLNPIGTFPSDELGHQVAKALQKPGNPRDGLTEGIYSPKDESEPAAQLERAFLLAHESTPILKKLRKAVKTGQLEKARPKKLVQKALQAGVIDQSEFDKLVAAEEARNEVIKVDAFTLEEMPVNIDAPQMRPVSSPKQPA